MSHSEDLKFQAVNFSSKEHRQEKNQELCISSGVNCCWKECNKSNFFGAS